MENYKDIYQALVDYLSDTEIQLRTHKKPFQDNPAISVLDFSDTFLLELNKQFNVKEVIIHKFLFGIGAHDDAWFIGI